LQLAAQAFSPVTVTAASAHARLQHWLASPLLALRTAFLLKHGQYCKQSFDGNCSLTLDV